MRFPDVSLGHLVVLGAKAAIVHDGETKLPAVVVELVVRDAARGHMTRIVSRTVVTPAEAADPLVVRECVQRAFAHEVDEWLRVDGRLLTDPHPR
jgi:hypothetical protein